MSQSKPAKEPAKTYTPAQHHTAKVDLRKAVALVQGKLGGKETAPDSYWQQAYQALIGEKGMDPALARAAIQLVRGGAVGAKTRAALERDYGITKFPKGSKRRKPPAYKHPGRPGSAPSGQDNGSGNDTRRPTAYNPDTDTGGPVRRVMRKQFTDALRRNEKLYAGPSRRRIT